MQEDPRSGQPGMQWTVANVSYIRILVCSNQIFGIRIIVHGIVTCLVDCRRC
jgi:hypothetical protein